MALVVLDVDRFKHINDSYGHGVGDEVLKEFAARLRDSVRGTDTAARLAGDEFVVILEGLASAAEAVAVSAKIGAAIRCPMPTSVEPLVVTASVGTAVYDGLGGSAAALIA